MVDLIRRVATAGLVLFVLITVPVALFPPVSPAADASASAGGRQVVVPTPSIQPVTEASKPLITLYYLHGNNFCRNCQAMRDFIDGTLTERFGPERSAGKLNLRTENFQAPHNTRFRSEFKVVTDAVVLVEEQNGATIRWKPLSKFWQLAAKRNDLRAYLDTEIRQFLTDQNKTVSSADPAQVTNVVPAGTPAPVPSPAVPMQPLSLWLAIGSAFALGLVAILSPCALATNLAAISFLGNLSTVARSAPEAGEQELPATLASGTRRVFFCGIAYAAGRIFAYIALGFLITAGLLSIPGVAEFNDRYINRLLGPLLILAGTLLIGWLPVSWGTPAFAQRMQEHAEKGGVASSFLLGTVFATALCPMSAALFFGGLLPLSVKIRSTVLLPASFGLATGLPVLIFAGLLIFASRVAGLWFNRFREAGALVRPLTGVLFVGVGLYFSLAYVYKVI